MPIGMPWYYSAEQLNQRAVSNLTYLHTEAGDWRYYYLLSFISNLVESDIKQYSLTKSSLQKELWKY